MVDYELAEKWNNINSIYSIAPNIFTSSMALLAIRNCNSYFV